MIGKKIIWFDKINSTNLYIKNHHKNLESGTIIAAKHQTAGYGRLQRNWEDSANNNLTFSLLLKLPLSERISLLTQVTAASVYKTLKELNIDVSIKWPNDIIVDNKKICGILLETILEKKSVSVTIGIGLNVNALHFTKELSNKATSMALETGSKYILEDILDLLIENLNIYIKDYLEGKDDFLKICRKNSYLIGKNVYLNKNDINSVLVKDIDNLGRLVVLDNNKEEKYTGSEVSLKNIYGNKEKNYG
jgi:BirA family biotin operon repressor/biotin-[acetyl-CoA-carboxylase] ligase